MNRTNTITLRLSDDDLRKLNDLRDRLSDSVMDDFTVSSIMRVALNHLYSEYFGTLSRGV